MGSSDDSVSQTTAKLDKFIGCINFYSCKDDSSYESGKSKVIDDGVKVAADDAKSSLSSVFGSFGGTEKEKNDDSFKESKNLSENMLGSDKQNLPVNSSLAKRFGSLNDSFERLIGVNLFNPVLTLESLRLKLEGRGLISFDKLAKHCEYGNLKDDWVVVGAVCVQTNGTAKTGSKFSVWTISDLKLGLNTASLFLFGEAHNRLWKNSVGTVIGVLNPSVMDSKSKKSDIALSVHNPDRVMLLGQSKDLGFCSAKRNNGGICNSVINKHRSEYCVFHFKKNSYSNTSKSYPQSTGRINLQNKVIGKGEVFYAGQSFTASKPIVKKKTISKLQKVNEKDKGTLKKLFENSGVDFESNLQPVVTQKKFDINQTRYKKIKDAEVLNRLSFTESSSCKNDKESSSSKLYSTNTKSCNTGKMSFSRESLFNYFDKSNCNDKKKLSNNTSHVGNDKTQNNNNKKVQRSVKGEKFTLKDLFNDKGIDIKSSQNSTSVNVDMKFNRYKNIDKNSSTTKDTDKVNVSEISKSNDINNKTEKTNVAFSRELLSNYFGKNTTDKPSSGVGGGMLSNLSNSQIIIDLPPVNIRRESKLAKNKALDYVKKHGPFKRGDLNKNWGQNPAKRQKVISELKDPSVDYVKDKKKSYGIDDLNCSTSSDESVLSARFVELMNTTSKHKDLLDDADDKFMEEYFCKMSRKEDMEVVMLNTFKVPCKAVRCIKCKYTWFSSSDLCKTENHPIVTIKATKRFFSCDDCGNRTVSLTILPMAGCKKCGSTNWKRAPILNLRKTVANLNDLSIRGGEQKFINSVESNTSLNLLVPE